MRVTKIFQISAAHFLPGHPKCGEMHGHNYKVEATLEGEVNPETGMVRDFRDITQAWKSVEEKLDHKCLNNFIPMPTAENLAVHIYNQLKPGLPELAEIRIWESDTAYVSYSN